MVDGDGEGEPCDQCEEGKVIESPCCGKKLMTTETGVFCSGCLAEVCDLNCEACGGEGVIYPPTREEIEEMKADD
jgi:hypothetical protein